MSRYYIDCEFDGHNGPLLSMALVPSEGSSIHINVLTNALDPWVIANVEPFIDSHEAETIARVPMYMVGEEIVKFIGNDRNPVIVCDSPQDARYFSQSLTTASDGGYAPFPFDNLTIDIYSVDCYPTTLPGAVQHNAWWDAMALRAKLA